MMPMFRIMMIGPVVKSLMKDLNMSKRKVGFTMDVSTSSVIVLIPVATAFVGFMISLVESGIQKHNLAMDPYQIFLLSILFNFYAIIMLVIGLIRTFWSSSENKVPKRKRKMTRTITVPGLKKNYPWLKPSRGT